MRIGHQHDQRRADHNRQQLVAARTNQLKRLLAKLLRGSQLSIVLTKTFEEDGAIVFREGCRLGCEGIVSKRLGSIYRKGRSPYRIKVKNPNAPAVRREAEEDWGR